MTPVGFEPTQLALVELESTPLDHSGKVSTLAGQLSNQRYIRNAIQAAAPSSLPYFVAPASDVEEFYIVHQGLR